MESFELAAGFCYNPSSELDMTEDAFFSGLLDVHIHRAHNIHNICIHANQDVYAKFSLTCSPDEALSTRVINGGGKNPRFDERIKIRVDQPGSVLKCEIWMLSRAKNYLEDQLLGFTLVPLSLVASAKGKLTQDFSLTSTDLFHSPAGTVQLTLCLDTSFSANHSVDTGVESALNSFTRLNPVDFRTVEFPDINIAKENLQKDSEYFKMGLQSNLPFLHLGASTLSAVDCDMTVNCSEDNNGSLDSSIGGIQNSGPFGTSTTTSLSDDKTTAESAGTKIQVASSSSIQSHHSSGASPDTPTSKNGAGIKERKLSKVSSKGDADSVSKENSTGGSVQEGSVFTSPLGNINLEAEQSEMQQQIVEMYMKSMQQSTESLANMKLPMDLGKPETKEDGDVRQSQSKRLNSKKKDGSRVFYGSRAFF